MPAIDRVSRIRQEFSRPRIEDLPAALDSELATLSALVSPGMRVAVAVGSRGIANLPAIVRHVVRVLRARGADPFVVPAMGSHGGATAAGQAAALAALGVTESSVGAVVRSSMEVVELPAGGADERVFMDRLVHESDGAVVVNRVKPHTDFRGAYESGLVKMCVIGLGKHRQALEVHVHGVRGLRERIPAIARRVLASGKVLAGVAIVENAYDETMLVRVVPAASILAVEPALLATARSHMPSLPVAELDVLVVDRIGKDISGCGLDTGIVGRLRIRGEDEPESPRIKAIVATELTAASHGNAVGVGLADVITRRLFDAIDLGATFENVRTSTFLERGKIPIVAGTDREAVETAVRSAGGVAPAELRLMRIRDTLHLDRLLASDAVCRELEGRPGCTVEESGCPLFAEDGSLRPF